MFNIILILLLIHLIGNMLFGNSNSIILSCGLYGFVADSPKKFNWDKFNILGSFNDSRGGDSCGRTHGNIAEWGINSLSKYNDYVKEMPNSPMNSNVIIGHSRKASSGGRSDKFAQPIIFKSDSDVFREKYAIAPRKYKKWANSMTLKYGDEPFIVFAGVHNGTLHNEEALATKYEINSIGKNDTTILLEIIFKYGYKVLEEYIGGAALLLYDAFNPDSLTVFKGHSSHFIDSTHDSEERPLYYWQKSDNSIYLSSLEDPLNFIGGIGGDNGNVKEIPENIVLKITNGMFVQEQKINRSKVGQRQAVTVTKHNHYLDEKWANRYNRDDLYDFDRPHGPTCNNSKFKRILPDRTPIIHGLVGQKMPSIRREIYPDNFKIFGVIDDPRFENERKPDGYMNHLFYWKGRYWIYATLKEIRDPVLANGIYYADFTGAVFKAPTTRGNIYYILDGMLMRGSSSYKKAEKILAKNKNKSEKARLLATTLTKRLAAFTALPIHTLNLIQNGKKTGIQDITEPAISGSLTGSYFGGSIKPPFSFREYFVKSGNLLGVEVKTTHNSDTLDIFEQDSYIEPEDGIKCTSAIKEFFTNNYAFCGSCLTSKCDDCVVLSDKEGKGNKVPEIGGIYMLDLSGKTVKEIIKANSKYYHDNYDFCDDCTNPDCSSCVVVSADGDTIPLYDPLIDTAKDQEAINLSENEAWRRYTKSEEEDAKDRLDNNYDQTLIEESEKRESAENSGQTLELLASDFSEIEITAGDEIAKSNMSNIILNIDNAMYEIEEEIMVMDRDSITKKLTAVIENFKTELTDLKVELM